MFLVGHSLIHVDKNADGNEKAKKRFTRLCETV